MRFLENHDEPRAAATFPPPVHKAAAVVALLARGLRFIYEGQLEGRKVHVSMHLGRRPAEPVDEDLHAFYWRFLECLKRPEVHEGRLAPGSCRPAWAGNSTNEQFIVSSWQAGERRLLTVVNYGGVAGAVLRHPRTCRGCAAARFTLVDLLGDVAVPARGRRPRGQRPLPRHAGLGPPRVRAPRSDRVIAPS